MKKRQTHLREDGRCCKWSLSKLLARFHRDEGGATLTEFVIMLPIFVLVFNGVMILGEFTRKGSEPPIRAYKKTFEKALPYQDSFLNAGPHIHPTTGGGVALDQMGTGFTGDDISPVHNRSTAVKTTATVTEGAAYGAMLGVDVYGGHMGESYARTKPIGALPVHKMWGCNGVNPPNSNKCFRLDGSGAEDRLTADIEQDLVGGSEYAHSLLSDDPDMPDFDGDGGALANTLNAAIDGAGIRPAIAAGIRYGTVSGYDGDEYTFAGRTMDMSAHFSTLVPPATTGGGQGPRADALRATAVTRTSMFAHEHYKDLPGIGWSQPLDGVSHSVPEYPGSSAQTPSP